MNCLTYTVGFKFIYQVLYLYGMVSNLFMNCLTYTVGFKFTYELFNLYGFFQENDDFLSEMRETWGEKRGFLFIYDCFNLYGWFQIYL